MKNLDYGIIGNGRSAALVSKCGSIDWACLADFDSPSVFAALLDPERGGRFAIWMQGEVKATQTYLRRTNLLCTVFSSDEGEFELIDFMPRHHLRSGQYHCPPDIVRLLRPRRGRPKVVVVFDPRLGYAEHPTRLSLTNAYLKAETTAAAHESVYLYTSLPLRPTPEPQVFELDGDAFFWLSYNQKIGRVDLDRVELDLERTRVYWLDWSHRTLRTPEYAQAIERSALVLKLLSFQETGAILAAATTSLPEAIGEVRNWDYRFCWIRDASMIIRTLVQIGHHHVAHRFFDFLLDVVPYKDERIQIMYGIRGQRELTEHILPWLSGYEGSAPVRIGNAAWSQQQNDIYGVLLDAIFEGVRLFQGDPTKLEALWTMTRGLVRHIETHWQEPDQGIWEIRGEPRHFTHSKLMCWVGLDRAMKLARHLGFEAAAVPFGELRDRIRADIMAHAWSEERQSFTQSYGCLHLDAATLLMERTGFIGADDPRWQATVRACYAELCQDGLTYRYRNTDDFGEPSSAFTVCSFWMIQALFGIGERQLARELFERVLAYSNHLGLFSEDLDFRTRRLLGNFPQGYSHLAIIDTALLLQGRLGPPSPLPDAELW